MEDPYWFQLEYVDIPSNICLKYFHQNISLKIKCFNNYNNHSLNIYNGTDCDDDNIHKIYYHHWYSGHCTKNEYYITIESYLNPFCETSSTDLEQKIYARISLTSIYSMRLNRYFFDDVASFSYCPSNLLTKQQQQLLGIDVNKDGIIGMISTIVWEPHVDFFKTVIIKNGDCIPHWFLSESCDEYGMYKEFSRYNTYCNTYSNRYYFNGNNEVTDDAHCKRMLSRSVIHQYGSKMQIKKANLIQKYMYYADEYQYYQTSYCWVIAHVLVVILILWCFKLIMQMMTSPNLNIKYFQTVICCNY